jgi:short-subunit dehydrogenase
MHQYFHDKVIWITGASSGIGAALLHELSQYRAKIIISARRENELRKMMEQCKSSNAEIMLLPFDLSKTNLIPEIAAQVIANFGRIDILFNNGGISQRSLVADTALEVDRKLMEINFFANVQLSKSVLPVMLQHNFGHLVVTSSLSGKFGFYERSAYAASKHALHGFYESLFLENRHNGIHITLVCPGSIKTDIALSALNKDGLPAMAKDRRLEQGMDAAVCAKKILNAVAAQKKEVLIGKLEIIPAYLKRFLPALFWRLMYRLKPEQS